MTDLRKKICCIELFNALEDGLLDERVSGVFLQPKTSGCCNHIPKISFCPFCSSEFRSVKTSDGWDWTINKGGNPAKWEETKLSMLGLFKQMVDEALPINRITDIDKGHDYVVDMAHNSAINTCRTNIFKRIEEEK